MPTPEFCTHCNCLVLNPCRIERSPDNGRVVYMATDWELRRKAYHQRLARAYARRRVPRRKTPDWLASVIFSFEGRIYYADGSSFCTPDTLIDDTFERDYTQRWLSYLKSSAQRRAVQRPQWRTLPRLRLIDLALKIEALDA